VLRVLTPLGKLNLSVDRYKFQVELNIDFEKSTLLPNTAVLKIQKGIVVYYSYSLCLSC
jgi:hypothetical protein